jgi:hypothetical protein
MSDHWDGTHPEDVLVAADNPLCAEWQVLVEETVGFGQDLYLWKLTRSIECEDRAAARRRAFEIAGSHQPQHPLWPQGRRIFQVGIDSWLVHVPGATQDFHFRVTVGHLVGGFDEDGDPLVSD